MMETGTYAKRLAGEIREACLKNIRTNAISYQELSRFLGVPYRGAMTIMQAKEWTLDRAVTGHHRVTMAPQARKTIQFGSK